MGGRLDATNVVKKPIAVIPLHRSGMDHMQFLGDTIEKIAAEKAVIKEGCPVISYNNRIRKRSDQGKSKRDALQGYFCKFGRNPCVK